MKKLILLVFMTTLLACHSYKKISKKKWEAFKTEHPRCRISHIESLFTSQYGEYTYAEHLKPRSYQMIKMDSLQYNYIYYLYDGEKIYKTIGLRDVDNTCSEFVENIKNCKATLQIGEKYNLVLHIITNPSTRVGFAAGFKHESIKIERDSIESCVFQSPQIQGKCYVKSK